MKKVSFAELFQPALAGRTILTTLLMTFAFFGAYAAGTYGAAMWQTAYKLPAATVGAIDYAGSAMAIIAYIVGGLLADAIGRRGSFLVMAAIGTVTYLAFGGIALASSGTVSPGSPWSSPIVLLYLAISLGFGYFGAQGVWLSELFPTRVRSSAQNLAYYVGRAVGAGLAPLAALILATNLGHDVRLAITFGAIGTLGTFLISLLLPETKGIQLGTSEIASRTAGESFAARLAEVGPTE